MGGTQKCVQNVEASIDNANTVVFGKEAIYRPNPTFFALIYTRLSALIPSKICYI